MNIKFWQKYIILYSCNLNSSFYSKATDALVHQKLKKAGGSGGVIAVDRQGNIATVFNTTGMFRAWATSSTGKNVAIGK